MYIVYQIIFPNNKSYIGITNNLRKRKVSHKCKAITQNYNYPVCCAIRKYGFDNLEWKILYEFEFLKDAELMEIKLIKEIVPNYNVASGGMVHQMTDDMKEKIRISNNKRFESQENRDKISNSLKEHYKKNPHPRTNTGWTKSQESRQKTIDANREINEKKKNIKIDKILLVYKEGMTAVEISNKSGITPKMIYKYKAEWMERYLTIKEQNICQSHNNAF